MKQFDFVGKRKIFFSISIVLILIGFAAMIFRGGLNYGIEFTGGTTITIDMEENEYNSDDVVNVVKEAVGVDTVQVQKTGDQNEVLITTKTLDAEQRTKVFEAMKEKFSLAADNAIEENNVGESTSKRILLDSLWAVIIAVALMLVYITIRFEMRSGAAAVVGLLHDVLIMIGFYALFQIPVGNSFVAAILTIIGYSINNTIIVFDRVREQSKKSRSMTYKEIVNKSINQTLARTINTSITTLMTIGMVYILGVTSMKEFALPIIVGLLAGTYSSIFVAGPLWVWLKEISKKSKNAKKSKYTPAPKAAK